MLRVALTCDDAPRMPPEPGSRRARPEPLRHFVDVLEEHGVEHCVAFVIGEFAEGREHEFGCWLEAGFELGNHSYDHVAATRHGPAGFLESIARCDEVLEKLGAFSGGRPRWFRFPYLDRGADAAARSAIATGLSDLGYRLVPASVDLYDHAYEDVLADALEGDDRKRANAIEARYVDAALASLDAAARRTERSWPEPVVHLPYFHIGAVSSRTLDALLGRLSGGRVEWTPVDDALGADFYARYVADPNLTGLVTEALLARPLLERAQRQVAGLGSRLGLFGESRLGPRFPHLE